MSKLTMKYPLLGSSVDSTQLSLTIKGVLGLVATILVGYGVSQADLSGLVDQIVLFINMVIQLVSLGATIYGGVRKVMNYFKK